MSSDEEFLDLDEDDEDQDFDDSFFEAPQAQAAPQPLRTPHFQPAPAPMRDIGAGQQLGMGRYLHPGAFQEGFGGHAFARTPASAFRRQYRAYSTAILEVGAERRGGARANVMFGGKIIMPPSALDELTQLDIELPITFEITNPALPDLNTHVGVLEFIAEEGTVNLPQWIMDQLRLNEGDPIRIWGGRYPKGKMIKLQAQSADFLEVSDPKAVLEQALRNFSCLSAGDIIEISYQTLTFRLLVMEITPPGPAIGVIDTDIEVDFAPPLGYVEPEWTPRGAASVPSMKEKFVIDTKKTVEAKGSGSSTPVNGSGGGAGAGWDAFKGVGFSLGGKRVKGKGASVKKIEPVDDASKIIRTDQPRIITADTEIGGRQVPAALNLPFGNLWFYDSASLRPAPGSAEEAAETAAAAQAAAAPFAGVGTGSTLSGRARVAPALPPGAASAPSPASRPPPQSASPAASVQPFGGKGQSLSGKKPIETIEID